MIKQSLAFLFLGSALASTPCFAHARLESSTPAKDAQLAQSPRSLVLHFSEAGNLGTLKLVSEGKEIPISVERSAKPSQSFMLPLPTLAAGIYSVQWSMVSADDGHLTKGKFTFTIVH